MDTLFVNEEERKAFLTEDNLLQLKALKNLVRSRQGQFSLALIQYDLPRWQAILEAELRKALQPLNLAVFTLKGRPAGAAYETVLDELRQEYKEAFKDGKSPDVVLVLGFEQYLA